MKNVLVNMLKGKGFIEGKLEGFSGEHSFLTLSLEKDVEVVWHGTCSTSLKVDVLVNLDSDFCRVDFYKDSDRAYKTRWYTTTGKRTYNAIVATIVNAGFEI
mgnify:CR=1 FL=1